MIYLKVHSIESKTSCVATFSLPMPPFYNTITVDQAESVQIIPVGNWPARAMLNSHLTWPWNKDDLIPPHPFNNPPRRCLVTVRFKDPAPSTLDVTLMSCDQKEMNDNDKPCTASVELLPGRETYHHRDNTIYHYVKREDYARIKTDKGLLDIRAAFLVNGEMRYWQWCETIPVWSGSLSSAWVVGGHIYAGEKDEPITIDELPNLQNLDCYKEATISTKIFVIVHDDGLVELTSHFTNVQGYGQGSLALGLPILEFRGESQSFDFKHCLEITEGTITYHKENICRWKPLDDSKIFIGNQKDNPLAVGLDEVFKHRYVDWSEDGFVAGVARSFTCSLQLHETSEKPCRYLADPNWYLKCGEFGIALHSIKDKPAENLQKLARDASTVYLRNIHNDGMSRGGVYRYLDEKPDGRYEFSMDGNETMSIFRAAYMATSPALYNAAIESARYTADIVIDHYNFNAHYHGDTPDWNLFSLIYMRFGGLVPAYLESGDPWYLENAEAVANRWISLNRLNQSRKNMGRDPEPVEGIMALYDATGKDHYFQEAQKVAWDVGRSLFDDASWRSGFGVGPYWGINALAGTPWNGSHLLAGFAEFLLRAHRDTCKDYDVLEKKAHALINKLIDEINRQMEDGVWRSAGGFIFRRFYMLACLSDDDELIERTDSMIQKILTSHTIKGEEFFKNGHHCGGYLDGPYVYDSLSNNKQIFNKIK